MPPIQDKKGEKSKNHKNSLQWLVGYPEFRAIKGKEQIIDPQIKMSHLQITMTTNSSIDQPNFEVIQSNMLRKEPCPILLMIEHCDKPLTTKLRVSILSQQINPQCNKKFLYYVYLLIRSGMSSEAGNILPFEERD